MRITLAKILLSIAAIQYGLIPPIIDFTDTHVFHPDWPPHARFHLVWLLGMGSAFSAYVLFSIWFLTKRSPEVLKHISVIGCIVLSGFFVAAAFQSQYDGLLSDMAEPIEVFGIDGNVFSFAIAAVFQAIGTVIAWKRPLTSEGR